MSIEPTKIEKAGLEQKQLARIYVDHTHLGRHVTGLERITQELFSPEALAPLKLTPVKASGTMDLVMRQNIVLPAKLALDQKALMLCPGFPPSFALSCLGSRVIPYIHDLFLLNRNEDLNPRARLYMAPSFRAAVKKLPRFLVNSQYTADELRKVCRKDAKIWLYRPMVGNVFGLDDEGRGKREISTDQPLRLMALGTVEPRKNLSAAAKIVAALRAKGHANATLDIVGRFGWGTELEQLKKAPGVTLHGYQSIEKTRELMARADLFINTSHDEGLGLPLLEAQYAGLPVIAPDAQVFKEVLGNSGLLINPKNAGGAARQILALIAKPDWQLKHKQRAAANLQRWNDAAMADRISITNKLGGLAGQGF